MNSATKEYKCWLLLQMGFSINHKIKLYLFETFNESNFYEL